MSKLTNIPEGFSFDDVLLVPRYSNIKSRSDDTDLSIQIGNLDLALPILPANMDSITEEDMAIKMDELGGIGIVHRRMNLFRTNEVINNTKVRHLSLSVGSVHNGKELIDLVTDHASVICIDIAHGDSVHMLDTLTYIRKDRKFNKTIIAGNVATPEAVKFLLEHGADIVKVGVGPGSVCTTRIKTGCGYPQLSAIVNCSEAGPIIADGGIRTPSDAAKALAGGAKAVMIGGMLAGTDKVPGWKEAMASYEEKRQYVIDNTNGHPYKPERPLITFRGMASKEARCAVGEPETNAEGVSRSVQCKALGSTEAVIMDMVEGIRSAMSYCGSSNLEEFVKNSSFVRVTSNTVLENHPHFKG